MNEKDKKEIISELIKYFESKELKIETINGATLPSYSHPTDVGLDIRANEDVKILPMQTVMIKTGLKLVIPEGCEIQIRGRSGITAKTPLKVSLGTIDPGFRDELRIVITNFSPIGSDEICTIEDKNKFGTYQINSGDRIAQIVFTSFLKAKITECKDVNEFESTRGKGFGSSGVK